MDRLRTSAANELSRMNLANVNHVDLGIIENHKRDGILLITKLLSGTAVSNHVAWGVHRKLRQDCVY